MIVKWHWRCLQFGRKVMAQSNTSFSLPCTLLTQFKDRHFLVVLRGKSPSETSCWFRSTTTVKARGKVFWEPSLLFSTCLLRKTFPFACCSPSKFCYNLRRWAQVKNLDEKNSFAAQLFFPPFPTTFFTCIHVHGIPKQSLKASPIDGKVGLSRVFIHRERWVVSITFFKGSVDLELLYQQPSRLLWGRRRG